jgi:hypothetical protein
MARDKRLLASIVFLTGSAVAGVVQAAIMQAYVDAAVMGNWTHFARTFGVQAPANGPDRYCFDYCAAHLPFIAGWISIACFIFGLALVSHSWLKPVR